MKSLSEGEFKAYVVQKAKEYIFGTTENLKKSVVKESIEDGVTLETVKEMVAHLKKVNSSLSFKEPFIEEVLNESETRREFKVGSYENPSIELKDTLSETMNNYNRKKSLTHGNEGQTQAWSRLVEYTKYKDDK